MIPLTELWDDSGPLQATRGHYLGLEEIKQMLREGGVQFVIASPGDKLQWVEDADVFSFWKEELKQHLCETDKAYLEDFPGHYFYRASEWQISPQSRGVLLEKYD